MKQAPIDPKKVYGKLPPTPPENTDITADPIDSPPEKSFVKDLPKEKAEIEQPKKDYVAIDIPAVWLAVLLTIASLIFSGSGLLAFLRIATAFGGLYFNFKNTSLNIKKLPRLGFNPFNLITIIDCILLLLGAYRLLIFFLSLGTA